MSTIPRFIQFHTLDSYVASLLNRDKNGMAKRIRYGGASRTRISSQSRKRHWRTADGEHAIHNIPGAVDAVRSRRVIEHSVLPVLEGAGDEWLAEVGKAFNIGLYGDKGDSESGRQPLLLGRPEIEFLQQQAAAILAAHGDSVVDAVQAVTDLFSTQRGQGANLRALREQCQLSGGLEGAMFGRMVTSDPAANIDAAIHVAHSFTVHAEESESDYFSVMDDLLGSDGETGAAHIGESELNSGIFYGYTVVDVPTLVSNLEGCPPEEWLKADRTMASALINNLMHLMTKVSPGAKLGSTAPYGRSNLMLVEVGSEQPRSLANAFRQPVEAQLDAALEAMNQHLQTLDSVYGVAEERRFMSVGAAAVPHAGKLNLDELCRWTAATVAQGEVKS